MVIGLAAALHVNAQGGGFQGGMMPGPPPGGFQGQPPMGPPPGMEGGQPMPGMMPQPMQGERQAPFSESAEVKPADICISGGHISVASPEDALLVIKDDTSERLTLRDVALTIPSGELMRVSRDKQRKTRSASGRLQLSTDSTYTCDGSVYADKYSSVSLTVDPGVVWNGAMNPTRKAKEAVVVVNGTWNLTRDSQLSRLVIGEGGVVNTNGHRLKCARTENRGTLR